jgi:hypothetical protein
LEKELGGNMKYARIGTKAKVQSPGVYTISFVDEEVKKRPKIKKTRTVTATCEVRNSDEEFAIYCDIDSEKVYTDNPNVEVRSSNVTNEETKYAKKRGKK